MNRRTFIAALAGLFGLPKVTNGITATGGTVKSMTVYEWEVFIPKTKKIVKFQIKSDKHPERNKTIKLSSGPSKPKRVSFNTIQVQTLVGDNSNMKFGGVDSCP